MSMCMKGLDGSNRAVRTDIAKLLGFVLSRTQADVTGQLGGIGGNGSTSAGTSSGGGQLAPGPSKHLLFSRIPVFLLLSIQFLINF